MYKLTPTMKTSVRMFTSFNFITALQRDIFEYDIDVDRVYTTEAYDNVDIWDCSFEEYMEMKKYLLIAWQYNPSFIVLLNNSIVIRNN